jgi:hypothetical protein
MQSIRPAYPKGPMIDLVFTPLNTFDERSMPARGIS